MSYLKEKLTEELIESLEGYKTVAYQDSKGIWTLGIGSTCLINGNKVKKGDTCTREEALNMLRLHLEKNVYPKIDEICDGWVVSERVYAGVCSLLYNVGSIGYSIIKSLHDMDLNELYNAFRMYNKITVNGVKNISQGLVNRREIEINFMEGS